MRQPPGFEQGNNKVLRLKKSLYGLKQAAKIWNETFHKVLTENKCVQNETDKCLYVKKDQKDVCYLLIHVDDVLVASNSETMINKLMESVACSFELRNLGGAKHYLGIDIEKRDGKFLISQQNYIDKIITEAGLENAKTSRFPLDNGYHKQEGTVLKGNQEYRKLIGMLLYLTTNTRPDIAASVSILSRRVEKPRDNDLNEVRRVIRYLKGTKDLKLTLNSEENDSKLHAYSDANWAEEREDRKSNSGYFCSANGGAISWCCRKQDVVALSSTEAEYVALSEACKELTWLSELAKGLDMEPNERTLLYTDSQSCISMIHNQKFSNRTKHIATKYHYIRDQVTAGRVQLKYVSTSENIADLMTKPLGPIKTEQLRQQAGLSFYTLQN